MIRENSLEYDTKMAQKCLKTLEKSRYKTVVVYNQGFWSNEKLNDFLKEYNLQCFIIGNGENVGIVAGRQNCFEYVWKLPGVSFVSELHVDMAFTFNWEDALVDYLKSNENEPLIGCGIVSKEGELICLNEFTAPPPQETELLDGYLQNLKRDTVTNGLTHPCIHKMEVLKAVGGFNTRFLRGKQAYEDDSLLIGYHYYYGIRANWKPKINYNSVVCHDLAAQRYDVNDAGFTNYQGLVALYGAMGLKTLAGIHKNQWPVDFFTGKYKEMEAERLAALGN
jgi:hypothetical protein